jgi:predicted transcriptional regulator
MLCYFSPHPEPRRRRESKDRPPLRPTNLQTLSSLKNIYEAAIMDDVERSKRREKFRQDALAAWAEYRATGRHVTAEEVDSWLIQLEASEDAALPNAG